MANKMKWLFQPCETVIEVDTTFSALFLSAFHMLLVWERAQYLTDKLPLAKVVLADVSERMVAEIMLIVLVKV